MATSSESLTVGVVPKTTTPANTRTTPVWIYGTGTPEAAVTAVVGSIFSRTDGGAGTSFYVKESGSGNTGWIGK